MQNISWNSVPCVVFPACEEVHKDVVKMERKIAQHKKRNAYLPSSINETTVPFGICMNVSFLGYLVMEINL